MENYQTYLISCCAFIWCSSPLEPFVNFRFATHISIYVMIYMLKYAFTHILYSLRILPLAAEMSDRQAIRPQARQIAATDPL